MTLGGLGRSFEDGNEADDSGSGEFTRFDADLVRILHHFDARSIALNSSRNPAFIDEDGAEIPNENGLTNPLQDADRILRMILNKPTPLLDEQRRPEPKVVKAYLSSTLGLISSVIFDQKYNNFYSARGLNPFNILEFYVDALLEIADLVGIKEDLEPVFETYLADLANDQKTLGRNSPSGIFLRKRETPSDPVIKAIRPANDGVIMPDPYARKAAILMDGARRSSAPPPPNTSFDIDGLNDEQTPESRQQAICKEMDTFFEKMFAGRLNVIAAELRKKNVDGTISGVYDRTIETLFDEAFKVMEDRSTVLPYYKTFFAEDSLEDRKARVKLRFLHRLRAKAETLKTSVLPTQLDKIKEHIPFYLLSLRKWLTTELGLDLKKDADLDVYIRDANVDEIGRIENLYASGITNIFAKSLLEADDGNFLLLYFLSNGADGKHRLAPIYDPILVMVRQEMQRMYRPPVSPKTIYSLAQRMVGPIDSSYSLGEGAVDTEKFRISYTPAVRRRIAGGYSMHAARGDAIAWVKGPSNNPNYTGQMTFGETEQDMFAGAEAANDHDEYLDPADVILDESVNDPQIEITGEIDAKDAIPDDVVIVHQVDPVAPKPEALTAEHNERRRTLGRLRMMVAAAVAAAVGLYQVPTGIMQERSESNLAARIDVGKLAGDVAASVKKVEQQPSFNGDKAFAEMMNGSIDFGILANSQDLIAENFIKHLTFIERSGVIDAGAKIRATNLVRAYMEKLKQGEKIHKIAEKNDPKFEAYLGRLKASRSTTNGFEWSGDEALKAYENSMSDGKNLATDIAAELRNQLQIAL